MAKDIDQFSHLETTLVTMDDMLHNCMSALGNIQMQFDADFRQAEHETLTRELASVRSTLEEKERTISELKGRVAALTAEGDLTKVRLRSKERLMTVYLKDLRSERMKNAAGAKTAERERPKNSSANLATTGTQTESGYFDFLRHINPYDRHMPLLGGTTPSPKMRSPFSPPELSSGRAQFGESLPGGATAEEDLPIAIRKGKRLSKSYVATYNSLAFQLFVDDFHNQLPKKLKSRLNVLSADMELQWQKLSTEMKGYYQKMAAEKQKQDSLSSAGSSHQSQAATSSYLHQSQKATTPSQSQPAFVEQTNRASSTKSRKRRSSANADATRNKLQRMDFLAPATPSVPLRNVVSIATTPSQRFSSPTAPVVTMTTVANNDQVAAAAQEATPDVTMETQPSSLGLLLNNGEEPSSLGPLDLSQILTMLGINPDMNGEELRSELNQSAGSYGQLNTPSTSRVNTPLPDIQFSTNTNLQESDIISMPTLANFENLTGPSNDQDNQLGEETNCDYPAPSNVADENNINVASSDSRIDPLSEEADRLLTQLSEIAAPSHEMMNTPRQEGAESFQSKDERLEEAEECSEEMTISADSTSPDGHGRTSTESSPELEQHGVVVKGNGTPLERPVNGNESMSPNEVAVVRSATTNYIYETTIFLSKLDSDNDNLPVTPLNTTSYLENLPVTPRNTTSDLENLPATPRNTMSDPENLPAIPQNTTSYPENLLAIPQNRTSYPEDLPATPQNAPDLQNHPTAPKNTSDLNDGAESIPDRRNRMSDSKQDACQNKKYAITSVEFNDRDGTSDQPSSLTADVTTQNVIGASAQDDNVSMAIVNDVEATTKKEDAFGVKNVGSNDVSDPKKFQSTWNQFSEGGEERENYLENDSENATFATETIANVVNVVSAVSLDEETMSPAKRGLETAVGDAAIAREGVESVTVVTMEEASATEQLEEKEENTSPEKENDGNAGSKRYATRTPPTDNVTEENSIAILWERLNSCAQAKSETETSRAGNSGYEEGMKAVVDTTPGRENSAIDNDTNVVERSGVSSITLNCGEPEAEPVIRDVTMTAATVVEEGEDNSVEGKTSNKRLRVDAVAIELRKKMLVSEWATVDDVTSSNGTLDSGGECTFSVNERKEMDETNGRQTSRQNKNEVQSEDSTTSSVIAETPEADFCVTQTSGQEVEAENPGTSFENPGTRFDETTTKMSDITVCNSYGSDQIVSVSKPEERGASLKPEDIIGAGNTQSSLLPDQLGSEKSEVGSSSESTPTEGPIRLFEGTPINSPIGDSESSFELNMAKYLTRTRRKRKFIPVTEIVLPAEDPGQDPTLPLPEDFGTMVEDSGRLTEGKKAMAKNDPSDGESSTHFPTEARKLRASIESAFHSATDENMPGADNAVSPGDVETVIVGGATSEENNKADSPKRETETVKHNEETSAKEEIVATLDTNVDVAAEKTTSTTGRKRGRKPTVRPVNPPKRKKRKGTSEEKSVEEEVANDVIENAIVAPPVSGDNVLNSADNVESVHFVAKIKVEVLSEDEQSMKNITSYSEAIRLMSDYEYQNGGGDSNYNMDTSSVEEKKNEVVESVSAVQRLGKGESSISNESESLVDTGLSTSSASLTSDAATIATTPLPTRPSLNARPSSMRTAGLLTASVLRTYEEKSAKYSSGACRGRSTSLKSLVVGPTINKGQSAMIAPSAAAGLSPNVGDRIIDNKWLPSILPNASKYTRQNKSSLSEHSYHRPPIPPASVAVRPQLIGSSASGVGTSANYARGGGQRFQHGGLVRPRFEPASVSRLFPVQQQQWSTRRCPICGLAVWSNNNLRQHMTSHATVRSVDIPR